MNSICTIEGCDRVVRCVGLCEKHYSAKKYRDNFAKNRDRVNAKQRERAHLYADRIVAYRAAHIDERKAYDKARYAENKEQIKQRARDYGVNNKKKIRESRKKRYLRDAEKIKNKVKQYRDANKDKVRLQKAVEFARNRAAEGRHDYTQLKELREKQKNCCAICKCRLNGRYHIDHIVPLVSGGTNWINNIQFLCPYCNLSKNKKDPIDFMQERGFLI